MKILILAFTLAIIAPAQTRVAWDQVSVTHTRPNLVWERHLRGQHIDRNQIRIPTVTATLIAATTLQLTTGTTNCTVSFIRPRTAIIQAVFYHGKIAIMTGYYQEDRYIPTTEMVTLTGNCIAIDTVNGRYPDGIQGFIYFGTLYMTNDTARQITGVLAPFMPSSYGINANGLISVQSYAGKSITYLTDHISP